MAEARGAGAGARRVDCLERVEEFPRTADLAAALGVNKLQLLRLCVEQFHAWPAPLLAASRLRRSLAALANGHSPAAVAVDAGWESENQLLFHFRRRHGLDPSAWQQLEGARKFSLRLPTRTTLEHLVRYWGRDPKSLSERVDRDGRRIRWALRTHTGPLLVEAMLDGAPKDVRCTVAGPAVRHPFAARVAHEWLTRAFGLHLEPGMMEAKARTVAPDLVRIPGLRIPQTPSIFDGLLWVVAGQQVSLASAFSLRRRLTERWGEPVEDLIALPAPGLLAAASHDELRGCGLSGRKAEYLGGIARAVEDGSLDLEGLQRAPAPEAQARLLAIRGLGPWSVAYLMMRSLGFADCVPAGDVALQRAVQEYCGLDQRPTPAEVDRRLELFHPWRSLAVFHLWSHLT